MEKNENKWVVVAKDMDGLTAYQVVHSTHAHKIRSGCYWTGIVEGSSLYRAEMQELADKLTLENRAPSDNPMARL